MNILLDSSIHMWFGLFITVAAVVSFMREKVSIEITSLAVLTALLVFGQMFPLPDATGKNQLDPMALLAGFANPSLIAVLALLIGVIGFDVSAGEWESGPSAFSFIQKRASIGSPRLGGGRGGRSALASCC